MATSPALVFLNHSSLVVKSQRTKILCDPWFQGAAFDNGWRLLAENSHNINDLDFDSIWISHEHPDHFSIPTLTQLKAPRKFLYQTTSDHKVRDFLTKREHSVEELPDGQPTQFEDLKLTTFLSDGYDTAALFEFENGCAFLNANDARLELGDTLERIQQCCPAKLDAVAVQFSYAHWAGNEGDETIPQDQQNAVTERILRICEALHPSRVILFASFVFYSHEENFYWNRGHWLAHVSEALERSGVQVIIPRPDQRFLLSEIGSTDYRESNARNLEFWQTLGKAERIVDFSDRTKTIADIRDGYHAFYDRLWSENNLHAVRTARNGEFKLRVRISDLKQTVDLCLFTKRIDVVDPTGADWDCMVSAETLLFLFRNKFGRGTVTVNARVQFHYETAHRFFLFFFIAYANNLGRYVADQRLSPEMLQSVARTSALGAIFKFHANAVRRFEEDLSLFEEPIRIHPADVRTESMTAAS
jgi:hypothetical protein